MIAVLLTMALALLAPPFQILTTHLPVPVAGRSYFVQLRAEGGTPPYQWVLLSGRLPPGLALDVDKGIIAGVPSYSKPYAITIQVTDSSQPPLAETRLLPASAEPPLTLRWTTPPTLTDGSVSGAVRAASNAGAEATLTLIVTAVNERGKAFALRYDHETLADGDSTPDLAFSQTLPPGTYTITADATAAVGPGVIYRVHQAQSGFSVPAR